MTCRPRPLPAPVSDGPSPRGRPAAETGCPLQSRRPCPQPLRARMVLPCARGPQEGPRPGPRDGHHCAASSSNARPPDACEAPRRPGPPLPLSLAQSPRSPGRAGGPRVTTVISPDTASTRSLARRRQVSPSTAGSPRARPPWDCSRPVRPAPALRPPPRVRPAPFGARAPALPA